MSHGQPGLVARGDIFPARFIKIAGSDFGALQCVAGDQAFGISREFVADVPYVGGSASPAARSGTLVQYAGFGEVCEVEVAEAVAAGDQLRPNAQGRGIIAVAGEVYSARVLQGQAVAGDRALVYVERGVAGTNTIAISRPAFLRRRVTAAEVNAGLNLLAAIPGFRYRLNDVSLISIGGNAGGATTVDIRGTQAASSVNLLAAAVAGLTQNTLLRAGAANAAILAGGASFIECDVNTPIQINRSTANLTGSTHIDVLMEYDVISA